MARASRELTFYTSLSLIILVLYQTLCQADSQPIEVSDAETTQLAENGSMDAAQTNCCSTSVNPSAPLKPSDPKFSQIGCSDEDDVPLSDLAQVSSDCQLETPPSAFPFGTN